MKINRNLIKKILIPILIIAIMAILAVIYNYILIRNEQRNLVLVEAEKETKVFKEVEKDKIAYLDLFTIYGNHLNINGYISNEDVENVDISSMKLVVEDIDCNYDEYNLEFSNEDGKVAFKLSSNINEGIDLNKISDGKHFLFIKLVSTTNNKEIYKLFSIVNKSKYVKDEYYTLTKDNKNNKVEILFSKHNFSDEETIDYMLIRSQYSTLPNNACDIVIDAGHGGRDPGAMYKEYHEADITLDYAFSLKEKLEKLGYKVALTRDKDEYVESYGNNGRAGLPYKTKAKLTLSIHLNSTASEKSEGGVEVYASNNLNLGFAKKIADNIVKYTDGKYSVNSYAKVLDGVYVRTYNEQEVKEANEYAEYMGYAPYESLSTSTPYLFMIREIGGIMTSAYIDGRDKTMSENPYRDSNISSESYLLELGFINSDNDLNNLLNKKNEYLNAIVDSIISNYN